MFHPQRVIGAVVAHLVHTEGVTGSNPVSRTSVKRPSDLLWSKSDGLSDFASRRTCIGSPADRSSKDELAARSLRHHHCLVLGIRRKLTSRSSVRRRIERGPTLYAGSDPSEMRRLTVFTDCLRMSAACARVTYFVVLIGSDIFVSSILERRICASG